MQAIKHSFIVVQEFKNKAKDFLNKIFSLVEKNYEDFDVDFEEEVLRIECENLIFILSIHEPTKQMWLSSPISGAHHFELKSSNELELWINTRDSSINLFDLIIKELDSLL